MLVSFLVFSQSFGQLSNFIRSLYHVFSIPEIYNFLWRERGRCRNTPKCPKVFGAKRGLGGMDAGLLFKAGNDLFGKINLGTNKK